MTRTRLNPISLRAYVGRPGWERLSPEEEAATMFFARKGASWATEKLLKAHAPQILRAAWDVFDWGTRCGFEFDDLAHVAVLSFYEALPGLDARPGNPFGPYLSVKLRFDLWRFLREYGTAIKRPSRLETKADPLTILADENAKSVASLEALREACGFDAPAPMDEEEPEEVVPEVRPAIEAAMTRLSPQQREYVRAYYGLDGGMEGTAELAAKTGTKRDSVKAIIKKARDRLRAELKDKIPLRTMAA